MTNILNLNEQSDGTYLVEYKWQTRRFLLQDGSTIDVRAVQDDSWLRDVVLKVTKSGRIEGVAMLPEPAEAKDAPVPRKRPAKKRAAQPA